MEERVTLYQFKSKSIRIHIAARFEKNDLVVEGYDIGKAVKDCWFIICSFFKFQAVISDILIQTNSCLKLLRK